MSVTVMWFTPEPTAKLDESFGMEVLHHIPFCRGKSFTGDTRYTHVVGFPTPAVVVFINDDNHHSDDLYTLFSLPGGSFYFQRAGYDHELDQCVRLLESGFDTTFGEVAYCENGDVAITFPGAAPITRKRILDDNRKNMLSAVS